MPRQEMDKQQERFSIATIKIKILVRNGGVNNKICMVNEDMFLPSFLLI
jgi:hypothetical protein